MATYIQLSAALANCERDHGVQILFAAESGSRAWGFESPDSDWDVRFIYMRSVRDYLSVSVPSDVIERTIQVHALDMAGWDIFKACRLLRKSNPSLIEWLSSPMVYIDDNRVAPVFREQANKYTSLKAAAHHYISMAKRNYNAYIRSREQVQLKKYLYAIRPILCAKWVLEMGSFPPTKFCDVIANVKLDDWIRVQVDEMLVAKQKVSESEVGPRLRKLDTFISDALESYHPMIDTLSSVEFPTKALDNLLSDLLLPQEIYANV